jgi:alpha-glucosidase (family GH31 glycosyl hydrolase)
LAKKATSEFGITGCSEFVEGVNQGYFIKDPKDKTGITGWWQGSSSGVIDMTNEAAVAWWHARLDKLKNNHGIASFKFDAGETIWLPYSTKLNGDENLSPNDFTTKYIDAIASYGGLVEARSAHRSQVKIKRFKDRGRIQTNALFMIFYGFNRNMPFSHGCSTKTQAGITLMD